MAAKTSQRFTAWLFRNHRWFGILPCVFVIMWGASGVLHPIMSRLSPQAAATRPPSQAIRMHTALEPREILQKAGIESVSSLRMVVVEGESYYQVTINEELLPSPLRGEGRERVDFSRRYFNINTGLELIDGDIRYAQLLARHLTGDKKSAITNTTLIEKFDDDYLSTNRLLPVYRIDFARPDGLRIYVETNPGRTAALVDNTKATLSSVFTWMHTWVFMEKANTARKVIITVLLAAILLSALSGLWIYGFMWKRNTLSASHKPLRRWHRTVGLCVSVTTILFAVSACWHLLGSEPRDIPKQIATHINAESLLLPDNVRHSEWTSLNAVVVEGRAYYQATMASRQEMNDAVPQEHAEHEGHHESSSASKQSQTQQQYLSADGGESLADAEQKQAIALAAHYSGLDSSMIADAAVVAQFGDEYGFINKRLPVWRVNFATADHAAFYVETSSGALAAVVRDADRYEGYSFSYLHKYHWLDFAGKNIRDLVMALFGLGAMLVAALGLWMFVRRYLPNRSNG